MERTGDPVQKIVRGRLSVGIPMKGFAVAAGQPWIWSMTCGWCNRTEAIDMRATKPVTDPIQGISTCNGWEVGFGVVTCPDCVETDEWCRLGQEWLDRWPEHLWQYNVPLTSRMDWHPPMALPSVASCSRWTVLARSYRDACRQIQDRLDRECDQGTYTVVYGIGEPEGYDTPIAIYFTEELM